MTTTVLTQEGLAVSDSVLGAAALRDLRYQVATSEYHGVHSQKWDKVWRLWDGNPQRGPSVYFDPSGVFGGKGPQYPTVTAVDHLIDAVRRLAAEHADVCGIEGVDWVGMYLCPWLYPPGSALSLHQDSHQYSGSFAFFVHSRWSVHWGGELIVYPPPGGCTVSAQQPLSFDEPWISDDADGDPYGPGVATAITPRPNRLVLIGERHPHRIARVDPIAGAHVRASVAGFFLRPP